MQLFFFYSNKEKLISVILGSLFPMCPLSARSVSSLLFFIFLIIHFLASRCADAGSTYDEVNASCPRVLSDISYCNVDDDCTGNGGTDICMHGLTTICCNRFSNYCFFYVFAYVIWNSKMDLYI